MTPPAAAAAPRTRTKRVTPPPRRVSGPARGRAAVAGPPPLALRLGGAVHGLAEHRWLDRVIRGRAWIGILAVGLIGIVFMQVSMLRLNAGIGRAVDAAGTLERENSAIRASISELSAGDRIESEATRLGLIVPASTARFLDARNADASRAAAAIVAPGSVPPAAAAPPVTTPIPTLAATGVAPSSATTTTPAPTTTTASTTTTSTPPPATTQTQATPGATAAAPPPADSGGAAPGTGQAG
ncbi:MAG: hypothetical protein QOG68_410 [Solirubrobacteraceae bacterium]|nr:hypothetical protein [Solirubrobacteraceae bacterium]